jgi:ATP-dependent RNA helicase DDX35
MRDPLLSKYSVIIVDEAHERGAYTDLLLGLLKKIRRKRQDLRIIVSSATIDALAFAQYFNEGLTDNNGVATVLSLEGRSFPVEIAYLQTPCNDYVQASIDAVLQLHLTQAKGDILVFLTGREEIDACMQGVADRLLELPTGSLKLTLHPLHAGLNAQEQLEVFSRPDRDTRKCIVATNVAEASVTIEGVKYIVDCGYVKQKLFDTQTGMESLRVMPISKASAVQRSGRAGRTSSGKCLRLYTETTYERLRPTTPSELSRIDLSTQILQLKALGIDNIARFDFLPPTPPSALVARSLETLLSLDALDEWGRLTSPIGERMAEMPLQPKMAKVVLESIAFRCTQEILSIAAMTSVSTPFIIPDEGRSSTGIQGELERRKFTAEEGDHLTLLNVYNAFVDPHTGRQSAKWCAKHRLNYRVLSRAVNIRSQLQKFLNRFGIRNGGESCQGDAVRLRKCLTSGLFAFAARMQLDGSYISVREHVVLHVHPSSVLFTRSPSTKWVIFQEVVETQKRFMRDLTVIEEDWLTELAPKYYRRAK